MKDAEAFLNKVVETARAIAFQAGVGQSETAGLIISILHNHPDWIDRFMKEGSGLFVDVGLDPISGSLSWQAVNGRIVAPHELFEKLNSRPA